ncbi:hypothetical protein [Nocardia sp. NPDC050406]|uniref:hypothetical protein n=1 Tax=Nocardia sp. NPDC050406 TaxID=3364318 RepID=UPI003787F723
MRKVKHRKPSRIKVSTSLTVAGAAVVATLMTAPANAVPNDPDAVPTAPAQPGDPAGEAQPQTGDGANAKPENGTKPEKPTPSQPGVNPEPDKTEQDTPETTDPQANTQPGTTQPGTTQPGQTTPVQPGTTQPGTEAPKPSQPGVTSPRVAPLPVPGQQSPAEPAAVSPRQPGTTVPNQPKPDETKPEQPEGANEDALAPSDEQQVDTLTGPQTTQPRWEAPVVETAPAAPVVEMTGPHTEIGANVDGGGLLPGFAANTHHFSNLDGYVGTVGYSTPGGYGDAGVSLEFIEANTIKVTGFVSGGGGEDRKVEFTVDTTQVNAAKAAAEGWIRLQPGGAAALEAVGGIAKLPQGDLPVQRIDVGGLTTQVGGSVQY